MIRLAKRLQTLPPYLFARIDAAAAEAAAKGLKIVKMGIGDPDRDPPEWIREILAEEVMKSGNHRYPSYKGNPKLWDAVINFMDRRFGVKGLGHENICTTIGSKEGLANLVTALLNPNDYFIAPDPSYPVFVTMARLAGARQISLPVYPGNNFMPDLHRDINEHQARCSRVMYVNYPHNPTGQVATREYLKSVVDFALEHNIILISDLAYSEIYYDEENRPPSLFEFEGAMDCAIEFHSFSKSFNMTGWRCGFTVGNADIVKGLSTVKSNVDSGVFNPIQLTMARVLNDAERCDKFLVDNRAHYKKRLNKICSALDEMGVTYHRPGASIFVWCDLPKGEHDAFAFCGRLLNEMGLVVSPGAAYGDYGEGFFRVSLSTPDETIDEALSLLAQFIKKEASAAK